MPLTNNHSYIPTADEFLQHWDQAETEKQADVQVQLPDGSTKGRNDLDDLRNDLETMLNDLVGLNNNLEFAWGDRDLKRDSLHPRFAAFGRAVRFQFKNTPYPRLLPKTVNRTGAPAKLLEAAEEISRIWTKIDAETTVSGFTPPLQLPEAYPLATFDQQRADLKTAFAAVKTAEGAAKLAREQRNDKKKEIRTLLVAYREAIKAYFTPNSPIVNQLPLLTPPRGSTPDAVNVSGMWDTALSKARLTWTLSENPNLDYYSIRYSPGSKYSTEDEEVVGSVGAGETPEFLTDHALAVVGAAAAFRVYVVLTTGNEKGSNTVKVERI